ncbi:MAG: hypothetical protein D6679_11190 [Candidatus Hydrogenedentota bacterium]|nr:MAG: hypothetical protein D6679_11190 [Candidatus Hydrogenedentota bacterium]
MEGKGFLFLMVKQFFRSPYAPAVAAVLLLAGEIASQGGAHLRESSVERLVSSTAIASSPSPYLDAQLTRPPQHPRLVTENTPAVSREPPRGIRLAGADIRRVDTIIGREPFHSSRGVEEKESAKYPAFSPPSDSRALSANSPSPYDAISAGESNSEEPTGTTPSGKTVPEIPVLPVESPSKTNSQSASAGAKELRLSSSPPLRPLGVGEQVSGVSASSPPASAPASGHRVETDSTNGGGRVKEPVPKESVAAYHPEDPFAVKIRPGDLVDVFVWGQDALSGKMRVAKDGSIVVRLAGSVRIAGLTVDEAADLITTRLRRYLLQPAVTVSIAEPAGKDILVVGEVEHPGPVAINRPTTLLDVLVQAGWKKKTADLGIVRIARRDTTIVCDIESVLKGRDLEQNISVEPGDIIVVPSREQRISLLGAFKNPGRYSFSSRRSLRVKDLLLESSMWTPKADIAKAFILHPDGALDPCDINALWFRGDATQDKVLRNDDSLVIPELKEIGVYILGKVSRPGLYTRAESFNLMQALTMAVPSTFSSRMYDIRVVRGWPDHPTVFRIDAKKLLEGDTSQNLMLEQGDVIYVPEGPISYTLEFWNRLLRPLSGTAATISDYQDLGN